VLFQPDLELPDPEPVDDYNRYKIGVTQSVYVPAEREVQDMLRLVAYDITQPRRLRRVAKTCQDYGVRVEKSVFECDLDEATFATFWRELNEEIDPDEDALVAYRICRTCSRETQSAGAVVRPGKVLVYLP